jgi:hypothetical protein
LNLNTLFLGLIALAVIIVSAVWLNDRFNPKTAEQILEDFQKELQLVLKEKLEPENPENTFDLYWERARQKAEEELDQRVVDRQILSKTSR